MHLNEKEEQDLDFRKTPFRLEKRRTIVGAWKNVAEFNRVYDWLFAETANNETCRRAFSQMRVWHLRRSTLCPAAVLATAVLVEVRLKDGVGVGGSDLQILYASAFTRFFNYMSSIMQTHNMRTMYDTARQLGLQSFVVDLRHICAHGQVLPPLEVLRQTAQYCLQWLRDYYWATQRESMCDVDASCIRRKDRTQFDYEVSQLFSIYDSALECYMNGARNIKDAKRLLHGKRFSQLKDFYTENNLHVLRESFDAIVKKLASLVRREAGIKDLLEIYIEALLKMKYFFIVAKYELEEAAEPLESLIDATQSLFRMLAVYGFIEDLFHGLLEIAENPVADATRRSGASFWARNILAGFVAFRRCKQMYKAEFDKNPNYKEVDFTKLNLETIPKKVRTLLIYGGVDLQRTLIFGDSFRRPWVWVFERSFLEQHLEAVNEYTAPVLKSLLPLVEPELTDEKMQTFGQLIDTLFDNKVDIKIDSNAKKLNCIDAIYTFSDLISRLNDSEDIGVQVNGTAQEHINAKSHFGIWAAAPDDETHNWMSCPLGRLPWE